MPERMRFMTVSSRRKGREGEPHPAPKLLTRGPRTAGSFRRDHHQPALLHACQDLAEGGMVRIEAVQPDGVYRPPDGTEQWVVLVFLRHRHDDVLAVHCIEQDGGIQPSEVVRCQDEISRRHLVQVNHLHVRDDVHQEADDGSQGPVFHGADFNAETRLIAETGSMDPL